MKTAKRLCAALLALALIFTLAGCNAQTTEPTPTPTPAQSETPAPDAAQDAPATSAPLKPNGRRQRLLPLRQSENSSQWKAVCRRKRLRRIADRRQLRLTGQLFQQTRCITGEHRADVYGLHLLRGDSGKSRPAQRGEG